MTYKRLLGLNKFFNDFWEAHFVFDQTIDLIFYLFLWYFRFLSDLQWVDRLFGQFLDNEILTLLVKIEFERVERESFKYFSS